MTHLRRAVKDYLAMRRGLGFKLAESGTFLLDFASFMKKHGASRITNELAVRWAKQPVDVLPLRWATRLRAVRLFALHWSAIDPGTEVPPSDLLPYRYNRRPPYLYTQRQITRLLQAARQLESAMGLRRWTYPMLLGLLSVTGLRISEALVLNRDAVNLTQGLLTIHQTKFGKSRLVPIHPSTRRALRRYERKRDQLFPKLQTPAFFVSDRGTRLTEWGVRWTFIKLSCQVGLRSPLARSIHESKIFWYANCSLRLSVRPLRHFDRRARWGDRNDSLFFSRTSTTSPLWSRSRAPA
jgi:site-specific recombinase XerD